MNRGSDDPALLQKVISLASVMTSKARGLGIWAFPLLFIFFLGALPLSGKEVTSSASLGLTVDSRGVLIRNGAPYRGVGVNYYDAFLRTLRNPDDVSYREGFAQLGAHGIPFARMAAGGYTGKDLQLCLTDREAYFQKLDAVIQSAQKSNVGLIASVFWSIAAVSEAVHEPRERWADAQSATRKFMRQYTQDVVSRYAHSPAIWGWEFSCELSLPFNLGPGEARADRALTYETFRSAALDFAQVVRKIDSQRMLVTGNSIPRANAYHNASGGRGADTEDQFATSCSAIIPVPTTRYVSTPVPEMPDSVLSIEESLIRNCYRPARGSAEKPARRSILKNSYLFPVGPEHEEA